MNTQETHTQQNNKYKPIPGNERIEIVKALVENKLTAQQVSDITGYNLSTIKAIYRVYKQEGRMWKKEKRDQIIQRTQNFAIFLVDDLDLKANFIAADQQECEIIQNHSDKTIDDKMGQMQALQFFKDNQQKLFLLLTDQDSKNQVKDSLTTLDDNQFQDISKISHKTKKVQKWKKIKKFFKRHRFDRYQIKGKEVSSKQPQITIEEKINDTKKILQSQMNYMIQNYNSF